MNYVLRKEYEEVTKEKVNYSENEFGEWYVNDDAYVSWLEDNLGNDRKLLNVAKEIINKIFEKNLDI